MSGFGNRLWLNRDLAGFPGFSPVFWRRLGASPDWMPHCSPRVPPPKGGSKKMKSTLTHRFRGGLRSFVPPIGGTRSLAILGRAQQQWDAWQQGARQDQVASPKGETH